MADPDIDLPEYRAGVGETANAYSKMKQKKSDIVKEQLHLSMNCLKVTGL